MAEATPSLFRQLDVPASPREPALSANDAALRWTPGPDELRLPSDEKEPQELAQVRHHDVLLLLFAGAMAATAGRIRWCGPVRPLGP